MAKAQRTHSTSYRRRRSAADNMMSKLIEEGLYRAWDQSFRIAAQSLPNSTAEAFDQRFWHTVNGLATIYLARHRTATEMGIVK